MGTVSETTTSVTLSLNIALKLSTWNKKNVENCTRIDFGLYKSLNYLAENKQSRCVCVSRPLSSGWFGPSEESKKQIYSGAAQFSLYAAGPVVFFLPIVFFFPLLLLFAVSK